jgi:hypothetical protein
MTGLLILNLFVETKAEPKWKRYPKAKVYYKSTNWETPEKSR